MKVEIKDNSIQVAKNFEKQIKANPKIIKTALGVTAEYFMGVIKDRTKKGKSYEGTNFKGYSTKPNYFNIGSKANPKYKFLKGGYKEFRKIKGRQAEIVDLNFYGNMLSNITQRSEANYAIIYFASKDQNVKALGNQERGRKFFGIGSKERQPIMNVFMKAYMELSKNV